MRVFHPYNIAKQIVLEQKFAKKSEYDHWMGRPDKIPATPNKVYKNKGWKSWGEYLGTNRVSVSHKQFKSFEDARAYVHTLKLKTQTEWKEFAKSKARPLDIPTNPQIAFKNKGYINTADWLGSIGSAKHNFYRSFKEARKFVRSLNIDTRDDWRIYCNSREKPVDIPSNPHEVYMGEGWISYGDWLGTGRIATFKRKYRPFEEARAFVHSLKFKKVKEWKVYTKSGNKPADIPTNIFKVYKDKGWVSYKDWLGTLKYNSK
jgi:hypothetical protein